MKDILAIADSISLFENYGIPRAAGLQIDSDNLYIRDASLNEIYVIDKQTLDHIFTISPPEGRGPGEIISLGLSNTKCGRG